MSIGLFGGNIKMKVLQINTVCGRGSTGRIATDIHKLLVEEDKYFINKLFFYSKQINFCCFYF